MPGLAKWRVRPCPDCAEWGLLSWQILTPQGLDSGCHLTQNDAMTLARHLAIKNY